jgi:hypothetical protein
VKPEVKMVKGAIPKTGPFRAGVWLNAFECEWLLERIQDEAFVTDLREKLTEARAQAERQTWSWAAGNDEVLQQKPEAGK